MKRARITLKVTSSSFAQPRIAPMMAVSTTRNQNANVNVIMVYLRQPWQGIIPGWQCQLLHLACSGSAWQHASNPDAASICQQPATAGSKLSCQIGILNDHRRAVLCQVLRIHLLVAPGIRIRDQDRRKTE